MEVKQLYDKKVFGKLFELANVKKVAEPLRAHLLRDPTNPATVLILWFMTIEPPFYACLSKECLSSDPVNIDRLGPFAFALELILSNAEKNRFNTIKPGKNIGIKGALGSFQGSYLLFKGAFLTSEQLEDWRSAICYNKSTAAHATRPQSVQIRGHMSFYETYKFALNQIKRQTNKSND